MPEKNDSSSKITSQSLMIFRSYLRDGALLYIFAALLLALLLPQIASSYLKSIDYLLSDFRTNQVNKGQRVNSIVIVDIDERSLREQGAWPWSREKVANLISILLDEYKATSIVMDMTFPEKRGGEAEFKEQVSRPQVVGGAVFSFKQTGETRAPALKNTPSFRLDSQWPMTKGSLSITNHPELPFAHVGHINRLTDSDGSIRTVAPFICDTGPQSFCLPTLSLAAYASQLNQPTFSMRK
jgi:adenylate cyclase